MPNRYAMTKAHKEQLAAGRSQSRTVRQYIDSLALTKNRRRTPEQVQQRLDEIEAELPTGNALNDLKLYSERDRLQDELAVAEEADNFEELRLEFVKVAADYGRRKGITYSAWRNVGVPASVLKEAGISRATRVEDPEEE